MKISATLIFSEEEEKKPLSLLISKSNGENLPIISFEGIESIESKEFLEVGQFKAEEVLLFSVLDHPSSNFVISVKDVIGTSDPQVFHLASPQVTMSIKFSSTPNALSVLDDQYDRAVKFLEDLTIPWFLRSSQVYTVSKLQAVKLADKIASAELPVDENTKKFIAQLTAHVQASTMQLISAASPLLTKEEALVLLATLDEVLVKYLSAFDSSVDTTKTIVVTLLRNFKAAVEFHYQKFLVFADEQSERAKVFAGQVVEKVNTTVVVADTYVSANFPETKKAVVDVCDHVATHATAAQNLAAAQYPLYAEKLASLKEQALSSVSACKSVVVTQYPIYVDKALTAKNQSLEFMKFAKSEFLSKIEEWLNVAQSWLAEYSGAAKLHLGNVQQSVKATVDSQISSSVMATHHALQTAQPYVHHAVAFSQPYVAQAVEVSQPYAGYLKPIVVRAVSVKEALEKNAVAGPYVDVVMKEGLKALESVKAYCLEDPVAASPRAAVSN